LLQIVFVVVIKEDCHARFKPHPYQSIYFFSIRSIGTKIPTIMAILASGYATYKYFYTVVFIYIGRQSDEYE
jgi:hypothetical protein